MKKFLLITILLTVAISICQAQISLVPPQIAAHLPDETAVVKDSTGKQYTYDEWTGMIAGRKYSIKANGRKKPSDRYPEYLLSSASQD